MASINLVVLLGHLGHDPEVRYTADGKAVANLSLATSERWKEKGSSEYKEKTEWHRVSLFGKPAEIAGEYLKKGSACYIEGRIQTRKWQDKQGQDRYTTEIIGSKMQLMGSKADGQQEEPRDDTPEKPAGAARAPAKKAETAGTFDEMDDDIPF